ncbi:MAG: M48 family metalloprotease, partial [Phycisphaerales bacterium JB038]
IAHEAGHIALGHTLATGDLPLEVSRNQEREADSFAASVLATSPSQEALFLGQVFTAILLTWQQYAWGDTEESTHPLAKERFENILRSHSAALKEMGKQYGLTEKFLRGLLPDGC